MIRTHSTNLTCHSQRHAWLHSWGWRCPSKEHNQPGSDSVPEECANRRVYITAVISVDGATQAWRLNLVALPLILFMLNGDEGPSSTFLKNDINIVGKLLWQFLWRAWFPLYCDNRNNTACGHFCNEILPNSYNTERRDRDTRRCGHQQQVSRRWCLDNKE